MVKQKSWEEFQNTGLLFFINQILHAFGWAITLNIKDNKVIEAYPARVKFRGFSEDIIDKGYTKITQYLKNNIDDLLKECEPIEEEV